MNSMMDRRTLLRGLGALSLAGAAGGLSTDANTDSSENSSSIDFSDDIENLRAYAKLAGTTEDGICLLYTSPSPRDRTRSRMPSSA